MSEPAKPQFTVQGLAKDLHNAYVEEQAKLPIPPAGVQMAPNLGNLARSIDAFAQKAKPILDILTTDKQYRDFLDAALALLHSFNAPPAS